MIIFDDAVIDLIYIFILQKKNLFRIIRDVTKICFKLAVRLYGCNIKYERIWIGIQSRSKVFSRHIFIHFKFGYLVGEDFCSGLYMPIFLHESCELLQYTILYMLDAEKYAVCYLFILISPSPARSARYIYRENM